MLTTRRLFAAILFIALFVMATREITDPDFWWHLRTGQYILETGSIPHGDIFSFTNAGRTWVTHEWLSEVLIFALYRLAGFPALILAFAGIIAATLGLVYARCDGKPYSAALAVLLAALAAAPTWGVRPQMLSLLFTALFLFILTFKREKIWLLAPLMILWVNLHSGFALGIVIIAIYLAGEFVERFVSPALPLSRAPLLPLALVLIACLAAVLINPNGATMYVYPFETLTSASMQAYIQEWFSPDFHSVEWQPFAWLMLGTFAAMAFSGKRARVSDILLLVVFGYAGLRSARNVPIFAIIAAPVLAEHLWVCLQERGWARVLQTRGRMARGMVLINWLVLVLIAAAGLTRIVLVLGNQAAAERDKFPAAAVDFLQTQNLAPLYNTYGWGGYLIWRLYPTQHVFIDGRADVYGDTFVEEYLTAWRGGSDWREPLDHYGVRVVLIEPDAPLVSQLQRDGVWQKLYEDKQAVVFARK